MGLRVIIERKAKQGTETQIMNALRELRTLALNRRGYVSGNTLRSKDDPSTYFVISTWQSLKDWEAWREDLDRNQITRKLEQFLVHPEKQIVLHFL
jgi:heme-degrading monooxygenase HmoA